jgi:hypothetical protein
VARTGLAAQAPSPHSPQCRLLSSPTSQAATCGNGGWGGRAGRVGATEGHGRIEDELARLGAEGCS